MPTIGAGFTESQTGAAYPTRMSASYSIDVDVPRDLVRITMSGFFAADDIAAFLATREAAHARLTCAPNRHVTINDLRGMKIQSQEVVDAFRAMLAAPRFRSRRLAFVAGPTLARSQLFRALAGRDARVFESAALAEAWLFAGDRAAA